MAIVMVANTGVMDLLLNFICSSEAAKIDLKNVVVFVGEFVNRCEVSSSVLLFVPSIHR